MSGQRPDDLLAELKERRRSVERLSEEYAAAINRWRTGVEAEFDVRDDDGADDFWGCSSDILCFARHSAWLPATRGFVACPFEISALRPASSVRPYEVRLAVSPRHGEAGSCRHRWRSSLAP